MDYETKTTVIVKFQMDGMHQWQGAMDLVDPEMSFLANRHRHMFYFTLSKEVTHDDRDIEFIQFKRDVISYLIQEYSDISMRTLEFGDLSCEAIARDLFERFDCEYVEVFEDNENGSRIEKIIE